MSECPGSDACILLQHPLLQASDTSNSLVSSVALDLTFLRGLAATLVGT
jgi:hypothetical protein